MRDSTRATTGGDGAGSWRFFSGSSGIFAVAVAVVVGGEFDDGAFPGRSGAGEASRREAFSGRAGDASFEGSVSLIGSESLFTSDGFRPGGRLNGAPFRPISLSGICSTATDPSTVISDASMADEAGGPEEGVGRSAGGSRLITASATGSAACGDGAASAPGEATKGVHAGALSVSRAVASRAQKPLMPQRYHHQPPTPQNRLRPINTAALTVLSSMGHPAQLARVRRTGRLPALPLGIKVCRLWKMMASRARNATRATAPRSLRDLESMRTRPAPEPGNG